MRAAQHRPLVLVVEDDSRLESALAMLIEDWGYDCITVGSPDAARVRLGDRIADVIAVVTDVSVQDGYGGASSASAILAAIGRRVPVIATASDPSLAARSGFSAVLAKPCDPDDLRRCLAQRTGYPAPASKAC